MAMHKFELTAQWSGGRLGQGVITAGQLHTAVSIPSKLQGPGAGTNPEEMLLGASAACYLITLAAIVERLGVEEIALASEVHVSASPSQKVEKIIHRPSIKLPSNATGEVMDKARQAAFRAEQACMISKALQGNVILEVEPRIYQGNS